MHDHARELVVREAELGVLKSASVLRGLHLDPLEAVVRAAALDLEAVVQLLRRARQQHDRRGRQRRFTGLTVTCASSRS